jgi:hypothetical protein
MFGGVPTIAMQILDHPDFASYDTSSIRSVSYGGAPGAARTGQADPRAAFPRPAGQRLRTHRDLGGGDDERRPRLRRASRPVAARPCRCASGDRARGLRGRRADPRPGRGPDVVGELWIKGPNVVRGYWNKPEATAKSFTKGWLHSGDIARIDDEGFVFIVDRAKDMIIRGGENVYSVARRGGDLRTPRRRRLRGRRAAPPDPRRGGRRRHRAATGPRPSRPKRSPVTWPSTSRVLEVPTRIFFRAARSRAIRRARSSSANCARPRRQGVAR